MARKKVDTLESAAVMVLEADAGTAQAVAPFRETLPIKTLTWFSKLGDQPPLRVLCGLMIAGGLAKGERRLVRAGAKALLAHSLATGAKNFVKHRIDRTRPNEVLSGVGSHRLKPGRNTEKAETSFPSGHSAGAIAVAQAFAREYPEYRAPALAAAGIIAAAQIPRCSHYPTDVGGGLTIGWASEALTERAWKAVEERIEERDGRSAGTALATKELA